MWLAVVVAAGLVATATAVLAPIGGIAGDRGAPSVPSAVTVPKVWTPELGQAPLSSAGLLLGGPSFPLEDLSDNSTVAVIGGTDDSYRLLPFLGPAVPGETVLLSPDGRRVAFEDVDAGMLVVAAVDGTTRQRFPPAPADGAGDVPLAWAPDGARLAVARVTPDTAELGVLELASGRYGRLAGLPANWDELTPFRVAFHPDGRRLAVQDGNAITVVAVDGARLGAFALPAGSLLAGSGAWTPDGAGLLLGSRDGRAWRFTAVDPQTGAGRAASAWATLPDSAVARAVGWGRDGALVVVAYDPEPGNGSGPSQGNPTAYSGLRGVRVLALPADGGAPVHLVRTPPGVLSVDVAAQAVASVRGAAPAPVWPMSRGWLGGSVFVFALLLGGVVLLLRR